MRVNKELIDPTRLRTIPREGFSWIDRRFVREGFIDRLRGEAILLYFFLSAVSDARGLSFYADPTIAKLLKFDQGDVVRARACLLDAGLVLYLHPIYQVLPLPETPKIASRAAAPSPRGGEALSLHEILQRAVGKISHG